MKKKIAFIINSLSGGGAEKVAVTLLNHKLFKENFERYLILLESEKLRFEIDRDVAIYNLTSLGDNTGAIQKGLKIPQMARALSQIKRKIKPDITFSHLAMSNIINLLTKKKGEKTAICEHDILIKSSRSFFHKCFYTPMKKMLYPKADSIITVSDAIKQSLLEMIGIDKNKITTIYNPINIDEIRELADKENIFADKFYKNTANVVSIGRLIPEKGFDIAIEAVSILKDKIPVKYFIIGDGAEMKSLKKKAASFGAEENIIFTGWIENPYPLIKDSDIMIVPSRSEGFGNVIVEAFACEKPVIAADCPGGPKEVLEGGKYGVLIPTENPRALADEIFSLINDKNKIASLSGLASERASAFDVNLIAEVYLKTLLTLAEN